MEIVRNVMNCYQSKYFAFFQPIIDDVAVDTANVILILWPESLHGTSQSRVL